MIANYHTHTTRCLQATGTEEEYIRTAIESGKQILGFSDHTPYPFSTGYRSPVRMLPEQLPEYAETIQAYKKQYASQIQLHVGLETEYYPAYFKELMRLVRDTDIEYMLLGQHWVGNEENEHKCIQPSADESILRRYCAQVRDAMQTGLFTYLAHPDVIHYTGDFRIYASYMRALCQEAKSCNMPLELNLLGLQANLNYPNPRFWEIAAEENCQVIIGCDAHEPKYLKNPSIEEKAAAFADHFHLHLLHTVPLRSVR